MRQQFPFSCTIMKTLKIISIFLAFSLVNAVFFYGDQFIDPVILSRLCDGLQIYGGLVISIGYICQIIRIQRRKTVKDISPWQLYMVFCACLFFQAYAVYNLDKVLAFFITNSICTMLSGIELGLYVIYSEKKNVEIEMANKI